jgi:hypothetical protein
LWCRLVVGSGLVVYLLGCGALGGMLMDPGRLDQVRTAALQRYETVVEQWRVLRTGVELRQRTSRIHPAEAARQR